jgi:hypothetical protein
VDAATVKTMASGCDCESMTGVGMRADWTGTEAGTGPGPGTCRAWALVDESMRE